MTGRQVIQTGRPFTLKELKEIMDQYWNAEEYNEPVIGRPTKMSVEEYILLPATERFLVIVYPRAKSSILSRSNKVILSVAENGTGAQEAFFSYVPVNNAIMKIWQTSRVLSADKERTGPAEEVLQIYTEQMKEILAKAGAI